MNWAMFLVMAISLWRDRAALVMAFVLPPLVFLIFSAVFSGATSEGVRLKVTVADAAHTPASQRLEKALLADPDLRAQAAASSTLQAVREDVRSGRADAGVVILADPLAPGSPVMILADPSRAVAAPLTEARVRETMVRQTPDILLQRQMRDLAPATGPLTAAQKDNLAMAVSQLQEDPGSAPKVASLIVRQDVRVAHKGGGDIAYYAGAVMILFALFADMHGALTLIDERRAGVADRILAGPAGMAPVVTGKFLFLIAQGAAQASAIFLTAQIVYDVPVVRNLGLWLITTVAAATCAGGLALGLAAVARTREQGQMLSTFVILVLAAVGGSMIPRFLMPAWLQTAGWLTPHAWVIDTYQGLLWRDEGVGDLYRNWIVMALIGLAGYGVARFSARRARR